MRLEAEGRRAGKARSDRMIPGRPRAGQANPPPAPGSRSPAATACGQPLEVGGRRTVLVEGGHARHQAPATGHRAARPPGRDGAAEGTPAPAPRREARQPTTRCALTRIRCALNAAAMPIGTKSSWLASVGMDPMLAGIASVRDSATRDAAVIWTIMKPDERPGSRVRKAGSPWDRSGFTSRSTRRSAIACSVVSVMASRSSA